MTAPRLSSARRWLTAALMLAVAALGALAISTTASAGAVQRTAPGDNGDVKIHKWTTPEDDQRDEPHVCVFYLVGFNFDAAEQVSWEIKSWPPTGDKTTVKSGTLVLDHSGHGRTVDMTLPSGHYKLFWTFAGKKGAPKQKVFWVECESTPSPTPTPTATPSQTPTPTVTPSQTPTPSRTPTTSQTPTVSPTPTPTPTASPTPSRTPTPTRTPTPSRTPTSTPTPGSPPIDVWIEWDEDVTPTQGKPKPAPTPTPVKTNIPVTG
ncbi:hypothetical protein [Microbispora catharanthi]|uniref:hypothetical protein n=1 Tax=Microbispora catharanthi TaxID=1712871 RepID=UPI00197B3F73|nr:hypothetical protein [Microbispora catharanthi]